MATQLLIDTDVLIDYLRDHPDAVSYVEAQQERLLISVVTVAELYAGVREGEERSRLERFLRALKSSHSTSTWPSRAVFIAATTAKVTMWG
jgi:predicted nucleic acid-binding protein